MQVNQPRWRLSAPESYVLLHGARASGREAFKLGLTELLARGALVLDRPSASGRRSKGDAVLRDGPRGAAGVESALAAIWEVYRSTPPADHGAATGGVKVDALTRAAVRRYGSLNKYVASEVLPALVERGLFEEQEGRVLWLFPTRRHVLTEEGVATRAELEEMLRRGPQLFRDSSEGEPAAAIAFAGAAGAALLLTPQIWPELDSMRQRGVQHGDSASTGGASFVDGDDEEFSGFGDFDLGGLDIGVFDSLGDAFAAIDSGLDAGGGGGGDGGGGGGDGGGGGGGGE